MCQAGLLLRCSKPAERRQVNTDTFSVTIELSAQREPEAGVIHTNFIGQEEQLKTLPNAKSKRERIREGKH